jgi:RNA polymerase sigma-70 factor (ECF subfamily)
VDARADGHEHDEFERHRDHLRAVARRMLGTSADADDAVQQAWLRYARADTSGVANLGGWLTTVVSRLCLDMLRSRAARREAPPLSEDAGPTRPTAAAATPEEQAVLVDEVGPALLVVLDRLSPSERVAFVLHDLFAVPYEEIAPIVERSPVTTKKLASRARHKVRGPDLEAGPADRADLARRRHLVDVFLAASRDGDMTALLTVLAPDVVRRADHLAIPAGTPTEVRGARAVAEETRVFAHRARRAQVALVDGTPGLVVAPDGRLRLVLRLTVAPTPDGDRITAIEVVADPVRLDAMTIAVTDEAAAPGD